MCTNTCGYFFYCQRRARFLFLELELPCRTVHKQGTLILSSVIHAQESFAHSSRSFALILFCQPFDALWEEGLVDSLDWFCSSSPLTLIHKGHQIAKSRSTMQSPVLFYYFICSKTCFKGVGCKNSAERRNCTPDHFADLQKMVQSLKTRGKFSQVPAAPSKFNLNTKLYSLCSILVSSGAQKWSILAVVAFLAMEVKTNVPTHRQHFGGGGLGQLSQPTAKLFWNFNQFLTYCAT